MNEETSVQLANSPSGELVIAKINGRIAKASCKIKIGDIVEIESVSLFKRVEISGIPTKNLKKQDAVLLYKVLDENKKEVFKDE